jgi:hypothetical protein
MSKVTVIVNPGFIVRTPGYRFADGQSVELDAHQASRLIASGDVRLADGSEPPQAPAAPEVPAVVIVSVLDPADVVANMASHEGTQVIIDAVTEPAADSTPAVIPCESEGGEA